jgi:hypothetical protein
VTTGVHDDEDPQEKSLYRYTIKTPEIVAQINKNNSTNETVSCRISNPLNNKAKAGIANKKILFISIDVPEREQK